MFNWFKRKSFKFQIIFTYIAGLVLMGVIGYGYLTYSQVSQFKKDVEKTRENLYIQNKEMIKTAVSVAENTINIANDLSSNGIVSQEKAKAIAVYELDSIKYGKWGYVWCITGDGVLLVDPPRKDLIGKNVLSMKDKNGFPLFQYIMDILKVQNEAFVKYYWEYPGIHGKAFEKLAYVKKMNGWNWIVGSGVYIKDIEEQVAAYKNKRFNKLEESLLISVVPGVISSLIVLLLICVIMNRISHHIERVTDISDRLSEGYVDKLMLLPELKGGGPLAKLIHNTNMYAENIYNFIKFKDKTETCISEEEIFEHIKRYLEKELKDTPFAIYINNDSGLKEYFKKGNIECESCERCLDNMDKIYYGFCPDKKREFVCISIISNKEVLAVVQIVFKNYEISKKKINVIRNYLQSTANLIYIRRLNKRLKVMGLRDQLTGLYNRHFLQEFFKTYESTIKRHNISSVIAMIDIDDFKLVNDRYGHMAGDELLKNIGMLAKSVFRRRSDLIIRYGGEEFLIVLPDISGEDAFQILDDFRLSVENADIVYNGQVIKRTVSIGYCAVPNDTDSLENAISYADLALYKAKSLGKNTVMKFDGSIPEKLDKMRPLHSNKIMLL